MDIDKVKSNIRAMLNLANDPAAAKGEIDNAMRFVTKLMDQHQLSDEDLSEVDDKLLELERKEMGKQSAYFNGCKLSEWESSAARLCCDLVGGVKYYVTHKQVYRVNGIVQLHPISMFKGQQRGGNPITKPTVVFYGIAEDVEIARQIFAELTMTIASMAKLKWGGVFRKDGREYCEGFVSGMWDKLWKERKEQDNTAKLSNTATTKSTALVAIESRGLIVQKKTELAQSYLEGTLGIKLSKGGGFSGIKQRNSDAREEGRNDGKSHSVSSERRRKLSGPGA